MPAWLPEAVGAGAGCEGRAGGALLREIRFLEGRWWEGWVGPEEGAWHATSKLISVPFPISHKIPHSGTKVWDGSGWGHSPNPLPAREAWLSGDSAQSLLKWVGLSEFAGTGSSVKATPHPRAVERTVSSWTEKNVPSSSVDVRGFARTPYRGTNTEPHGDTLNS